MTREKESKAEAIAALMTDIDPAKYAGEGWTATEEVAKPSDIKGNKRLRSEIGHEGSYYPETYRRF